MEFPLNPTQFHWDLFIFGLFCHLWGNYFPISNHIHGLWTFHNLVQHQDHITNVFCVLCLIEIPLNLSSFHWNVPIFGPFFQLWGIISPPFTSALACRRSTTWYNIKNMLSMNSLSFGWWCHAKNLVKSPEISPFWGDFYTFEEIISPSSTTTIACRCPSAWFNIKSILSMDSL